METRKYLFETAWKQYLTEAAATDAAGNSMMDALETAKTDEERARALSVVFGNMSQQQIESALNAYEARPPRWWVRYKNWLRRDDHREKLAHNVANTAVGAAAMIAALIMKLPEKLRNHTPGSM